MSKTTAKKIIKKAKEEKNKNLPSYKSIVIKKEYEGYKILVRCIGEIWDYFIVINGELYNATNVFVIPEEDRKNARYYTKEIFDHYTSIMLSMAMATVDAVALKKKVKKTKEMEMLGIK
jgi:hypothetical protein